MKRFLCSVIFIGLLSGCTQSEQIRYYQIEGFYVFPIKQIHIGEAREVVVRKLGKAKVIRKTKYTKPNRIELSELPCFDEQWGYFEELANNWVFFKNGRVVAAFREKSDY